MSLSSETLKEFRNDLAEYMLQVIVESGGSTDRLAAALAAAVSTEWIDSLTDAITESHTTGLSDDARRRHVRHMIERTIQHAGTRLLRATT